MKTTDFPVNRQTSKYKIWVDEAGNRIPFARITKLELLKERKIYEVLNDAVIVHNGLQKFKEAVAETCRDLYEQTMLENKVEADDRGKGNFTIYNFDRSIKITVKMSDRIEFDDLQMKAARVKFDEFLNSNITSSNDLVKQLVTEAFEARGGKLDTKKVMGLLKWKSKINDAVFQEAMSLIESAIRRPSSKAYYQIAVRKEDGSYENINLDFASV